MAQWDTFENRWEITADLVAETGLRVGAGGELAEPTATDLPVLRDAQHRPYIPGSSLRGVLRSHLERLVRGLEPGPGRLGRGACKPVHADTEWCVTSKMVEEWREQVRQGRQTDDWLADQIWDHSCRVCQTFGNTWLASRVRLADLYTPDQLEAEIRDGVAIDRDKETVQHKYDFEAVAEGARFRLKIVAENLEDEAVGLLWLGLRELERGHIQVGGFKGRGLGWVNLTELELQRVNRQSIRDYLLSGRLSPVALSEADGYLNRLVDEMVGG